MTIEQVLVIALIGCLPLAALLYAGLLHRLQLTEAEVLKRIDPDGFRALNASSQVRFLVFVQRGAYRSLADPLARRLAWAFRWLFYLYVLGWLVIGIRVMI